MRSNPRQVKLIIVATPHIYNPPQTPPFEKEGLVVSLVAYLTRGESVDDIIFELQYVQN